jgi:hypothetical protein
VNDPHLKDAFASFFSPKYVLPFLIGAVVVGVLGNAVYQLLANLLGTSTGAILLIIALTLVALVMAVGFVLWQAGRPGSFRPLINPWRQAPRPRRGLIFLFGRKEVCREALAAHEKTLERLWLVCTPQSNTAANEFASELQAPGRLAVEVRVVGDANDPLAFYAAVQQVIRDRPKGWPVEDVITDYVGLTAHASVGTVLACLHEQAPVQYTPAEYDANLRPVRPLPPFEVVLQGRKQRPQG